MGGKRTAYMQTHSRAKEAVRNFHVPLPESIYHELKAESEQSQRSANALAREAIEQWLEARRRDRLDQAIREYVDAMAGSGADLDPDLEAASLEIIGHDE